MGLIRRHSAFKRAGGYSAEVQAVLNRFTGSEALTAAEILKVQTFVDGLVLDSMWSLIDEFWWFRNIGTEAKSLIGFKNFTATKIGSPVWSSSGWGTFSAGNMLNSGFNVSFNGYNFTQNNAMIGTWGNITGVGYLCGAYNIPGYGYVLMSGQSGNQYMNTTVGGATGNLGSNAFKSLVRTASNLTRGYVNGVQAGGDITQLSSARPNLNLYIGGINNNGVSAGAYSGVVGCQIIGAGVGIDHSQLNSRIVTLLS